MVFSALFSENIVPEFSVFPEFLMMQVRIAPDIAISIIKINTIIPVDFLCLLVPWFIILPPNSKKHIKGFPSMCFILIYKMLNAVKKILRFS
jgi:hypothetical protein